MTFFEFLSRQWAYIFMIYMILLWSTCACVFICFYALGLGAIAQGLATDWVFPKVWFHLTKHLGIHSIRDARLDSMLSGSGHSQLESLDNGVPGKVTWA